MAANRSSRGLLNRETRQLMFQHWLLHSQALGQCRRYLQERYPDADVVEVNSTAKAAQEAVRDPDGLAICSYKCAEVYDLQVVDRDIQDAGESERAVTISEDGPWALS